MSDLLTPHSGIPSDAGMTAFHSVTLVMGAVRTEELSIAIVNKTMLSGLLLRVVIHFMTARIARAVHTRASRKFVQNIILDIALNCSIVFVDNK